MTDNKEGRRQEEARAGNGQTQQKFGVGGGDPADDRYVEALAGGIGELPEAGIGGLCVDQHLVTRQVGRVGDRRGAFKIGGRGRGYQGKGGKAPGHQAGFSEITQPQRQIVAFLDQIEQAILESYQSREGVKTVLSILSKKSLDETLYEQVIEDTLSGAPEAKSSWPGEGMLADISAAARRISVPSVVIVGGEDVVETESRLREEIPKAIIEVTFDVLPGLGHLAPLEGPDAVAAAIRRFVLGLAG